MFKTFSNLLQAILFFSQQTYSVLGVNANKLVLLEKPNLTLRQSHSIYDLNVWHVKPEDTRLALVLEFKNNEVWELKMTPNQIKVVSNLLWSYASSVNNVFNVNTDKCDLLYDFVEFQGEYCLCMLLTIFKMFLI